MKKPATAFLIFHLFLAGCGGEPAVQPPPPPTMVDIRVESGANANPDNNGLASPVQVRIYTLRGASGFNAADFFAIYDREQATLGGDLIDKQELLLKPGESQKITLQPADQAHVLGFFAAFRELDTARWRATADIQAHQTQQLTVKLNNNQLTVQPAEPAH